MSGFDWPALYRFALRDLKLSPAAFWALTPFEFGLMVGPGGPVPLGKSGLRDLMVRFPDNDEEDGNG